jgi:PAS domain-containing protein
MSPGIAPHRPNPHPLDIVSGLWVLGSEIHKRIECLRLCPVLKEHPGLRRSTIKKIHQKEGRPDIKSPINYGDFLESPPPVPWEADARTWCFSYVGPQAFELLGFPVEDWYDPPFWTRQIHPDDRLSAITTRTRLSAQGGSCEFAYRMVRSDEAVIWVNDIVAVEMMGDSGSPMLKGFLIDVTERMAMETELSESENLLRRILHEAPDALELTASLAHELNQPLSAIVANAQAASRFLSGTTPDLAEIDNALGDIAGDAKRAGEVIRHMRDLLRERDILPAPSSEEDDRQA